MHYFVMEPLENTVLPAVPKGDKAEVVKAADVGRFGEIDYDARHELISDRLKMLIERYMPRYDFQPVVFLDMEKEEQAVFWRFSPPLYADCQTTFRNDGIVSHISCNNSDAPVIFTVRSPKGVRSIIVKLPVAESVLRRCIFGLEFTKLITSIT